MMKKIIAICLGIIMVSSTFAQNTAGGVGTREYRESYKEIFIDFTLIDPENEDTLAIEFSDDLKSALGDAELPNINYGLQHWRVVPQSSIALPEVLGESFVKGVEVQRGEFKGQTVLGIKLRFPAYSFDMTVEVEPPFLPLFYGSEATNYIGNGVIDNVGNIKSVYLTTYGLQQKRKTIPLD